MNAMITVILAVQMLSALAMIGLILVQHGKGADMGAAFGSGNSGSLFGASGGANFLSRTTAVLAAVFFVTTLMLAYFGNLPASSSNSVLEGSSVLVPTSKPAPVDNSTASPSKKRDNRACLGCFATPRPKALGWPCSSGYAASPCQTRSIAWSMRREMVRGRLRCVMTWTPSFASAPHPRRPCGTRWPNCPPIARAVWHPKLFGAPQAPAWVESGPR